MKIITCGLNKADGVSEQNAEEIVWTKEDEMREERRGDSV
jgi:hypothetical protein